MDYSKAACKGATDVFFPERGEKTSKAKAICSTCPVKDDCLEVALVKGEKHGLWGGLSERERRDIRKARRERIRQSTQSDASAAAERVV